MHAERGLSEANERRRRVRRGIFVALLTSAALGAIAAAAVPALRWRAQLVIVGATGGIPEMSLREVLDIVAPGSPQNGPRLLETRSPYAVIHNPVTSSADVERGRVRFAQECASCHGPGGDGGPAAPKLHDRGFTHGDSDWAVYTTIRSGVPGTAMASHPMPAADLWAVIAFVRSLGAGGSRAEATAVSGYTTVSAEALARAPAPAADWPMFSGSYDSRRHSALTAIDARNVHALALRWNRHFNVTARSFEATPLVHDGTMYVTLPGGRVFALDASSGATRWTYAPPADSDASYGAVPNRGVALLGDYVYVGVTGAKLVALDARSGTKVWETAVSNDPAHYSISGAPLAFGNLVITGVATHPGGRGYIAAFDARTGVERWRFYAIPGNGEPGNDTWAGESWREGGGPTFLTGTLDVERDLLFWGVGNPKPDYEPSARAGDNLYTNSIVALRASTGKLVWHFQFTPADDHDWDSCHVPVLVDVDVDGRRVPRVLVANRNGFYYELDRESGRFIRGLPFAKVTWTAGLDAAGRPQAGVSATNSGAIVYPGNVGATNWWPPSYDRASGLFFIPVLEQGMVYFSSAKSWPKDTGRAFHTAVRAIDVRTGALAWERVSEPRTFDNHAGGLLTTASGLLFGTDGGKFFALEARTGRPLFSVQTGDTINAAPSTYEVGGEQYVAIASGSNLMAFALPKATPAAVLEPGG